MNISSELFFEPKYEYVSIKFKNDIPSRECLERLSEIGVECMSSAYDGSVFGILERQNFGILADIALSEVESITVSEPPNSK